MADPLSIAASIAGLITITQAALAGVHSLIHAIKDYDENMVKLVQELAAIDQLLQLLRNALPDYSDRVLPGNPAFEPLRLLQTTLQEIEKLKPKDSKREKALWITLRKDKAMKDLLRQLERHKGTISSLLSVHQVDLLREALSSQATLSNKMDSFHEQWHTAMTRHEKKKLQQYYHSDNPFRLFKSAQKLHQEHTGGWFINGASFTTWIKTDRSKLWVYGIPGAGKTVLSSLAIRTAKYRVHNRKSAAVIYFFCDNSVPESQDIQLILGSLIYQLANSKDDALEMLEGLHAERSNSSLSLKGDQLDDLHSMFQQIAGCFEDITVVVDGLDECEHFKKVSEQLTHLANDDLPTRLLFFSRDEVDIRYTLGSFQSESIAANNDDLKLYIASQVALRTQEPNGDLPVTSQRVKDRIRKRLAEGAQGQFRWVECQIDALCQCANEEECEEILSDLPHGLKESYDRILDRINKLPDKYQDYVQKALQWTCFSRTPLTLKALCEIVAVKSELSSAANLAKRPQPIHDRKLLQWCSSFLRHSSSDGLIEIAHYSVKEYLKEPKYEKFCVTDDCHAQLGRACLHYLLLNDYKISDQTSSDEHSKLLDLRPFRRYAIKYWVNHCTGVEGKFHNDGLLDLAETLLQSSGDRWFYSFSVESHYFSHEAGTPPPPPPPPPPNSAPRPLKPVQPPLPPPGKHPSTTSLFLDSQVKVNGVTPLHWASSLWLWQLTKPLATKNRLSVDLMTNFGTPLHCAVDRVFPSLGGFRDLPSDDRIASTIISLVDLGESVNRPFERFGYHLVREALLNLTVSSSRALLKAGFVCDRKSLQGLSTSKGAPRQRSDVILIMTDVNDNNVLEHDRDYWQSLKDSFSQAGEDNQSIYSDESYDSDRMYDSWNSTGSEPETPNIQRRRAKTRAMRIIDADDDPSFTDLHRAAKVGNFERILQLITTGAHFDARDAKGQSAIHLAAQYGYVDVYNYLSTCAQGCSVATDLMGRTPLHLAASNGSVDAVKAIQSMSPTADVMDALDLEGYSPLLSAAQAGQSTVLEYLLGCSPEVDGSRTTQTGMSALHLACLSQSSSAVGMLLKRGLDPNAKSRDGSTALHFTCTVRDYYDIHELVEMLLEAGANPAVERQDGALPIHVVFSSPSVLPGPESPKMDDKSKGSALATLSNGFADHTLNGNTALHFACKFAVAYSPPPRWISLLFDQGYDPFKENDDGQSSLEILLGGYEDNTVVSSRGPPPPPSSSKAGSIPLKLLLKSIASSAARILPVGIRKKALRSLSCALKDSEWELCELLIDLVDDTSELDPRSTTSPLLHACQQNCSQELFQRLVSKSSDLSRHDIHGYAPLHKAVTQGRILWVKVLVSRGADVNQHVDDKEGMTPLLLCCTATDVGQRIAHHLIASGADVNLRNWNLYSPIHQFSYDGGLSVLESLSSEEIIAAGHVKFMKPGVVWKGMGCFQLAVLEGRIDVIAFLLDRGITNVNEATEEDLVTALHIAAYRGNILVAKFLLKAGAQVNIKNALGETPFHTALRKHEADMMDLLLDHGAATDGQKKSVVWMEVVGWDSARVRHILKRAFKQSSKSQNISLTDVINNYQGRSNLASVERVLHEGLKYAIEGGNTSLVDDILSHNPSLEDPTDDCRTCGPLLHALRLGEIRIAYQMIEAGCSLDVIACRNHETFYFDPANYAASLGEHKLLGVILSQGYTCKAPVHPIHAAILKRHTKCVEVILDNVDFQTRNTAVDISSLSPQDPPSPRPQPESDPDSDSDSDLEGSEMGGSFSYSDPGLDGSGDHPRLLTPKSLIFTHIPLKPSNVLRRNYPIEAGLNAWPWTSLNYLKGKGPMIGWSALHLAVVESQETTVHLLLRYGAIVDYRDRLYRTPLHMAVEMGNLSMVNILLKNGASQFAFDYSSNTPLYSAITLRRPQIVENLLNPRLIGLRNASGRSSLHAFAEYGNEEGLDGVRQLIELGAGINDADDQGLTPLHLVAKVGGDPEIVQFLVESGADVHARTNFGQTALFHAVGTGSHESCIYLVQQGAALDALDNAQESVLHTAMARGSIDIVKWLIKVHPSLLSMKNSLGCTPDHRVLWSPSLYLDALEYCPDLTMDCNFICGSPLHEACRRGRNTIVAEIIRRLSREELHKLCRKTTSAIPTPMIFAVQPGRKIIVRQLLAAGVGTKTAYPPWETPLDEAVKYGRKDITILFLEHQYEKMDKHDEQSSLPKAVWVDKRLAELFGEPLGTS